MAIKNDKFRDPNTSPDKERKADPINKKMFKESFKNYMNNQSGGFSGVWNPFIGMDDAIGARLRVARGVKKDEKPDDEKPPDKPIVEPPLPPAGSGRTRWEDIVGFHFPKPGMAEGGLVRGGGKAIKGRGRGKMV